MADVTRIVYAMVPTSEAKQMYVQDINPKPCGYVN